MSSGRPSGRDEIIGKAFMWSSAIFLLLGAVATIIVISVRNTKEPVSVKEQQLSSSISGPNLTDRIEHLPLPFANVNSDWNIDFSHQSGAQGDKLLPETLGSSLPISMDDVDQIKKNGKAFWKCMNPCSKKIVLDS